MWSVGKWNFSMRSKRKSSPRSYFPELSDSQQRRNMCCWNNAFVLKTHFNHKARYSLINEVKCRWLETIWYFSFLNDSIRDVYEIQKNCELLKFLGSSEQMGQFWVSEGPLDGLEAFLRNEDLLRAFRDWKISTLGFWTHSKPCFSLLSVQAINSMRFGPEEYWNSNPILVSVYF